MVNLLSPHPEYSLVRSYTKNTGSDQKTIQSDQKNDWKYTKNAWKLPEVGLQTAITRK